MTEMRECSVLCGKVELTGQYELVVQEAQFGGVPCSPSASLNASHICPDTICCMLL